MLMKRTTYENVITRHTETTVALDRSRTGRLRATREEYDAIGAQLGDGTLYTFDGLIEPIERAIASHVPPVGSTTNLTRLSNGWYAQEIHDKIVFVRALLLAKQPAVAAAAALELGALLVEARAAHVWGANLDLGRKVRRKNRAASQRAATDRLKGQVEKDARIRAFAGQYRQCHPYLAQQHSTRRLAEYVASHLSLNPHSVPTPVVAAQPRHPRTTTEPRARHLPALPPKACHTPPTAWARGSRRVHRVCGARWASGERPRSRRMAGASPDGR